MIRRLVLGGESLEDGGILSALWPRGLAGRFWLSLQKLQILPTIPFNTTLDSSDSFLFLIYSHLCGSLSLFGISDIFMFLISRCLDVLLFCNRFQSDRSRWRPEPLPLSLQFQSAKEWKWQNYIPYRTVIVDSFVF